MRKSKIAYPGDNEKIKGGKWLLTFNDLMTLLMVFFVLLFAMGTINVKDMKEFQYSLQSGLGVLEKGEKTEIAVVEPHPESELMLDKKPIMPEVIEDYIKTLNSMAGVGIIYTKEGIVIRLKNTIIYESGKADINPNAAPVLDRITQTINKIPNHVRIEGHTDNVPINTSRFPSNWELSTSRAVNVAKYFVNEGRIDPKRLSVVGYGEAKPLFPNDSPEHTAMNRRVEIVLLTQEGS